MNQEGYTNAELRELGTAEPTRGLYCPKCNSYIPKFLDLAPEEEIRLLQLREASRAQAFAEIMKVTGCSLVVAKIWAIHSIEIHKDGSNATCSYCGKELRTPNAKQCRHCKRDWHDLENMTSLPA